MQLLDLELVAAVLQALLLLEILCWAKKGVSTGPRGRDLPEHL